jgi:hypothetical protein
MLVLFTIKTPKTAKRFWFTDDFESRGYRENISLQLPGYQTSFFAVWNPPFRPPEVVPSVRRFFPRTRMRRTVPGPRYLKAELAATARFRKPFLDFDIVSLLTNGAFARLQRAAPKAL